jgi:hypothetical protein
MPCRLQSSLSQSSLFAIKRHADLLRRDACECFDIPACTTPKPTNWTPKPNVCGFLERLVGFYLVSRLAWHRDPQTPIVNLPRVKV